MKTVSQAGYRMTVESWENDADNHNTVVKEGLSKAECMFYVDLCKLFKHSTNYNDRICNLYEPSEAELARVQNALHAVALRHDQAVTRLEGLDDPSFVKDQMFDILFELGLSGSEFYTRVCNRWKVEHVPVQIVLTNVTEDFK